MLIKTKDSRKYTDCHSPSLPVCRYANWTGSMLHAHSIRYFFPWHATGRLLCSSHNLALLTHFLQTEFAKLKPMHEQKLHGFQQRNINWYWQYYIMYFKVNRNIWTFCNHFWGIDTLVWEITLSKIICFPFNLIQFLKESVFPCEANSFL